MKDKKSASLFQKEQVMESLKQSFVKLNPRVMIKNPIMFTVELVTLVMLVVCILSLGTSEYGTFGYNFLVFVILFVTLLFANFAEAIAEARGKAQADSLRKTREETPAKVLVEGKLRTVSSARLKKGDFFVCEAGDTIPADGEIVEGLASIDESAITGEPATVIREAGGDKSSVTGGTKVLSDKIKVLVTQQPGESFLDKMIALVEGATRKKTPNEIALTILLAGFTLVFVIVCITNTERNSADYLIGRFFVSVRNRMYYVDSDGGLYQYRPSGYVYLYCGYSLIVCLPDTDNYRRLAFGNRYCRYGSRPACQCNHKIGQSR